MVKKLKRALLAVLIVLQLAALTGPAIDATIHITASAATKKTAVKITKQPVTAVKGKGKTAKVTVTATGKGLTYKWYYKDRGSKKYKLAKSFTGSSYSIKMSSARSGRRVYCVVTDKYGNSVQTKSVALYMGKTIKITKQPVSVTKASGSTAKVTLKAYGDGLTYKWYYKDAGSSSFKLTKSFTGKSYSVKMSAARNGRQVYCVVTDKYGKSVKSDVVTLKMPASVKITKQPASMEVANGETAKVTIAASGKSLTYKWYYKDAGSSKFKLTKTFTGNSYSVKMSAARNGRQVYCVVKDKYGNSVKTEVATFTVKSDLKITKQPASITVAKGQNAQVSVSASGEILTYKWYFKDTGSTKFTYTKTFKGNTYSTEMSAAHNGRQVYCVISDQLGNSIQTNTVTLSMGKELKITKQLASAAIHNGERVNVSFTATGDDITYKWYFKDASSKKFSYTKTFTGNTYSIEMSSSKNGRQVYCVVTDKYGTSVQTDVITLSATHYLGKWEVYKEATVEKTGTERRTCSKCDHFEERTLNKLKAVTYITVDSGSGDPYKVGVAENGKYSLTAPTKPGYDFTGWKTSSGKDFAAEGVYTKNITVKASWKLADTSTLAQLVERTDAGVDKIKITGNIVVDKPIFISGKTHIYADGNFSITRDPSYAGDIFVVGETRDGKTSVMENRKAHLKLGDGKGVLTIDGNKSNLKVAVSGSAIFVNNTGDVDLHEGVVISNHKKLANDRALTPGDHITEGSLSHAGGAAILNVNGTVNMHGGIIENCEVFSATVDEAGNPISTVDSACGGAVYNRSSFNMYGGIIRNNLALRGGAIYTDRVVMLEAGTITGNTATTYAAAVYSSGSVLANLYIGSDTEENPLIISNNAAQKAGGAVYSNTHSLVVVYKNAVFEGNSTQSIGGAIYTGGPLSVFGATFKNNESPSQGGAIYHNLSNAMVSRRYLEIDGAYFEGNKSWDGGAIALGAYDNADNLGTYAYITNSVFKQNRSFGTTEGSGSGGAIYASSHTEADITQCTFEENVSGKVAGALYVHKDSTVNVSSSTFHKNSAIYGGAINVASGKLTASKLTMTENTANYGGAFFLNPATVTITDLKASGNSATSTGGVLNTEGGNITISGDTVLENNTAATRGGALYVTKSGDVSSTFTMTGGILQNNTAGSGGAVSVRATCDASFDGTSFVENASTDENADNSLYLGGGALDALEADVSLANVTMTGNTSAKYGGAVLLHGNTKVSFNNTTFTKNTAKTAGAIYFCDTAPTVTGATFSENTATESGGAVVVRGAKTEVTVSNSNFSKNTAANGGALHLLSGTLNLNGGEFAENTVSETGYGGAIMAGIATINANGTKFSGNTAYVGAAASLNGTTATITGASEFKNNTVTNRGGAIDVTYQDKTVGTLTITGGLFEGNSAVNGGAINVRSGNVTVDGVDFSGNTVTDKGAAINLTEGSAEVKNVTASTNSAYGGGAFSVLGGTATFTGVTATKNNANNGGVLYVNNADATVTTKDCSMTSNTATNGGAICISSGSVTVDGGIYQQNATSEGASGGAIYAQPGTLVIKDATFTENTAGYGGAISINGTSLTVSGKTEFKNNVATVRAGAIDVANSGDNIGNITFADGLFEANEAPLGGAVSMRTGCTASFTGTQFKANKATNANTGNEKNIGGGAIYVHENGMLTLTDAEFDGNTSGNYGGAVMLHKANLTMTGGKIVNSEAISGTGAALYLYSCKNISVTGTEISNNTAKWNGAVYTNAGTATFADVTATGNNADNGSVFYISGGEVTISNLNATKNTATTNGGVIYVGGGTVTVSKANATENTAPNGGVVYAENAGAVVTLKTCTMTGNTASNGGAVLLKKGATITVDGGEYSKNAAGEGASGGAFYSESAANLVIKDAVVNENTAGYGGAVAAVGGKLTTSGTTFNSNVAKKRGGVLEISGNSGDFIDITITGGIMEGNTAPNGGAVATKSNYNVTFDGTELKTNKVPTSATGGAVQLSAGSLTLKNVTATGNEAGYGGAVFANGGTVNVTGGTYTGNRANEKGGAIHIEGTGALVVNGLTASGNYAKYGAVLCLKTAQALDVTGLNAGENGTNADGVTVVDGGTIQVDGASTVLNLTNSTIKNNTVSGNGGAIIIKNGATVNINGGEYSSNAVGTGSGGAVYVAAGSTLSVKDATMNGNTAGYGGAIAVCGGKLTVSGTTFKSNVAKTRSGALEITDNTGDAIDITITGGLFESNEAPYGGAVATKSNYNVTFDGTEFKNNKVSASANGGAVQLSAGSLTLKNVTATGNEAGYGGAVFANGGTVNVIGGTYTGNRANDKGGAVYIEGATLTATDGLFEANTALNGGALVIRASDTATFTGTEFKNNQATAAGAGVGGAIYVYGAAAGSKATNLTLTNVTFTENKANGLGGAIATNESAPSLTINASGCAFIGNQAGADGTSGKGGGALEIRNGNAFSNGDPTAVPMVFTNCTFTNNTSTGTGGAIDVRSASYVKFDGITATGNISIPKWNGAVIYITSEYSRLYLTGTVTASDNVAGGKDTFAYISNAKSGVYTTHGSDASWVAMTYSAPAIQFNQATLP